MGRTESYLRQAASPAGLLLTAAMMAATGLLVLLGLLLRSLGLYLLFHSLAELFSIVVAVSIFTIAWNARRFLDNNYLLLIGVAYLFVGGLDLVHTLAFWGMGVFPGYGADLPTQLWISARGLQAMSLLAAPLLLGRPMRIGRVFLLYGAFVTVVLALTFGRVFPTAFDEGGGGLTAFKVAGEYVICAILAVAAVLLWRRRRHFAPHVLGLVLGSMLATIVSEVIFTQYIAVDDVWNMLGHVLKVVAFYLIYRALVHTGLRQPYALLFRQIKHREEQRERLLDALRQARDELEERVRERTSQLESAVDTLQGEVIARERSETARLRLAGIVESSDDAVIGADNDGRIDNWNVGAERLFGRGAPEAVGQCLLALLSDEHQEEPLRQILARVARGEPVKHFETRCRRADGRRIAVSLSLSPIRDGQGRIAGIAAIARDITERRRLEAEVLRISEMERQRIGHDLHDMLGQNLTGIAFMTRVLRQHLERACPDQAGNAARIEQIVNNSVALTRSLARGLSPVGMKAESLMSGLRELCGGVREVYGLDCEFVCPRAVLIRSGIVATHLYRIAQEAVNNAVKHAQARRIEVRLHRSNGTIRLAVADDGVGLPGTDGSASRGMGLRIMRYRAGTIGGTLRIARRRAGGTKITCMLPRARGPGNAAGDGQP